MTLLEYVQNLQKFIEENPATADWEAVHSRNDGGGVYEGLYGDPYVGIFDPDEREFILLQDLIEDEENEEDEESLSSRLNAVCIN